MAYFPLFIDLEGKQGLVVGGGTVAARKIRALLPYGPRLTVCAPSLLPQLEALPGLDLRREPFSAALLDGACFVLAATDDPALNQQIAVQCKQRNIPVNVADPGHESTFLFPALVRRGPLTIGISTGGASPSAAQYLREEIDRSLPHSLEDILLWMEHARQELKLETMPQARRAQLLSCLFSAALQRGGPLSAPETRTLLAQMQPETEVTP